MELVDLVKSSIEHVEREIESCHLELAGERSTSILHRNYFKHIIASDLIMVYFDEVDERFQQVRERAREIEYQRDVQYDALCRIHLDIGDMVSLFYEVAGNKEDSRNFDEFYYDMAERIKAGELIGGAEVMNYGICVLKRKESDEILKTYNQILAEILDSGEKKESVRQEIKIFEQYVVLCREKLEAIT